MGICTITATGASLTVQKEGEPLGMSYSIGELLSLWANFSRLYSEITGQASSFGLAPIFKAIEAKTVEMERDSYSAPLTDAVFAEHSFHVTDCDLKWPTTGLCIPKETWLVTARVALHMSCDTPRYNPSDNMSVIVDPVVEDPLPPSDMPRPRLIIQENDAERPERTEPKRPRRHTPTIPSFDSDTCVVG